ncbi:MAG: IclR family transcriptional regulator [Nitrolancea sp.]
MADRSVLKALTILDTLGGSDQGMLLSELANVVGFPISTTHRLLKTMASQGYVEKDAFTGRYVLGSKVLHLQIASTNRLKLVRTAFPHLRKLTHQIDEAANLSTLSDGRVVYLESVAADRAIGLYSPPGSIAPAHCTAMGKVLLASLGEAELSQWLAEHELTQSTPTTITDRDILKKQLIEIRAQGHAIDNEEWVSSIRCIAAPIQDYSGRVIAAASVSIPMGRLSAEREVEVLAAVKRTCVAISSDLGYR